jgi:tubulin polyglutamylase TTLL6/13
MSYHYKKYHNKDLYNGMQFQILGFDIMLDKKLKSWLLEVNTSPSFTDDTPLDTKIKTSLIVDTLRLLNVSTSLG